MASARPSPDYEQHRDELARTIRRQRDDCDPYETARQLLEYESPGNTALVGINDDATRAVLYHDRDEYVVSVGFGPDGLADGGPRLAEFEPFGTNVYGWVRRMAAYWGWLNPRFRWS